MLILIILLIGAVFVISTNNIDIKDEAGREVFVKAYSLWLGNAVRTMKEVTIKVINTDWLPDK